MKKLLIGLSALFVLFFSGCSAGKRTVFNNIKDTSVDERNVAIIKDDYFHYIFSIKKISFFNKSTGKFEDIFNRANSEREYLHYKFILQPGTYNIFYRRKSYKGPWAVGSGRVELKAGHKYRVNHASCSLYAIYKRFCRAYTDAIWFEDLNTGEVLSGYKWKHLSNKSTSPVDEEDEVSCERIKKD